MSVENIANVWEYVSSETIGPAEQTGRAQFVVDSIAEQLAARRSLLLYEAEEIQTFLDTHTLPSSEPEASDRPTLQTRIEQLQVKSVEEAMRHINKEPPFVLWFESNEYGLTLHKWIDRNRHLLIQTFGRQTSAFTRAASALSRALHDPSQLGHEIADGKISGVRRVGPDTGIVIGRPSAFFERAQSYTNYGAKSMIATLCIADLQRTEREQKGIGL